MIRLLLFIYILLLAGSTSFSQNRDAYWVFGDSVGINFNTVPPTIDTNRIIMTEEAAATISDENGNLLFYVGSKDANPLNTITFNTFTVRNALDSIMQGGDSLVAQGTSTQGLIIIPDPGDSLKYYIFHVGAIYNPNPNWNVYYSIVDMSLNNGLGEVITKNIFISNIATEKMYAVKAANGTDWRLILFGINPNPYFMIYYVDSTGISLLWQNPFSCSSCATAGQLIASRDGAKLLSTGGGGQSYIFQFDRCQGIVSSPVMIDNVGGYTYGCSFSPSGRYAYLSTFDSLWQYDTQAANIIASKQLIFNIPHTGSTPPFPMGQHMLAPDGKIYIASLYQNSTINYYDSLNTHIHVIQHPDSAGLSCDFSPYSFSLQGRKSYGSLPNMPNYNLGVLEGVNCDSILAANAVGELKEDEFQLYPNPTTGSFYINWKRRDVENANVVLLNLEGSSVMEETTVFIDTYQPIEVTTLPAGIYFVKITASKGVAVKKLMVVR